MAKKPTVEDARLILELYDLRREAEMRKARQWWLNTFWPKSADDILRVLMERGTDENNWLRQVLGYWGIAASFVANGVLNEKLFFDPSFCGELLFLFAKIRPLLADLREKTQDLNLLANLESLILRSKLGRAQLERAERTVASVRPRG